MESKQIRGFTFFYPNKIEFMKLVEEIFKEHVYYVELDRPDPLIIDCGAHIGLVSLYYKQLYPQAKVIAFEPEPRLVEYLIKNIDENRFSDIQVVPKAVWSDAGQIELHVDSDSKNSWLSTSSLFPGGWTTKESTKTITVEAVKLSEYLTQPVDVLKLDIEKAETQVLKEIQPKLSMVRHLFVEFHATREHRPEELVTILLNAGFELTVYQDHKVIPINRMTRRKPTLYLIEATNRLHAR